MATWTNHQQRFSSDLFQEFSGIESEWPLFFALLVIDGVFKKDEEQVDRYQEKLRKHLSYSDFGGEGCKDSESLLVLVCLLSSSTRDLFQCPSCQ